MEIKDKMIEKNKNIGLGDVVKVSFETDATYYLVAFSTLDNKYCLVNLKEDKVPYRNGGLEYIIQYLNEYIEAAKCDWYKVNAELTILD